MIETEKPKNSGKFGKGNPGKPKGAVTKVTADIKGMILTALTKAGGAEYLERRANDPRTAAAFLGLVGKVLPMQISGDPDNPLKTVVKVELVAMSANSTN
jgi:hypothetical protein